jgi:hypothetical protein
VTRSFFASYLDEDVDVLIASLLRSRGFSVVTTVEAKKRGATDSEQIDFICAMGFVLVTHNRSDFEDMAREFFESGKHHPEIIIAARRSPQANASRLISILNEFPAETMQDRLLYI